MGPRGQGRTRYTTSGSVTSSWLASSVKVRVLQLLRLYIAPSAFGGAERAPPTRPPRVAESKYRVAAIFPLPVWPPTALCSSFLWYFGQYGRRIVRDGQAIGPRGQGRTQYTTSGSVASSWLASSVKVRVLRHTALRRAVGVRGRRTAPPDMPPTVEPTPNTLSVSGSPTDFSF